jgi:hypothetical protein
MIGTYAVAVTALVGTSGANTYSTSREIKSLTAMVVTIPKLAITYAQAGTSLIVATGTEAKVAIRIIITFAAVAGAIAILSGTC